MLLNADGGWSSSGHKPLAVLVCSLACLLCLSMPHSASCPADLMPDAWIGDLGVLSQQQGLGENDGKHEITLERQIEPLKGRGILSPVRHNAEVLIIRFHEDIA